MPRIRKKTSRRQSINDRRKIQRKVREGKKKKAKQAKKNPQWKSKPQKLVGVLNTQEDVRRGVNVLENDKDGRLNVKASGEDIASLAASAISEERVVERDEVMDGEGDDDENEDEPVLFNRDLPTLKAVLNEVDVIVEVLDVRDPLAFRSQRLEELVVKEKNKKVLLVLNKIDTCPREAVASWAAHLRSQHPTLLFRSATAFLPLSLEQTASNSKIQAPVGDGVGIDSVLECLGQWAQEKGSDKPLTVGVVGWPNSGKSSFLNTLLKKRALPVYSLSSASPSAGPSTTALPQEIVFETAGHNIRFIDTPGLSWVTPKDAAAGNQEELRTQDILLRSKGRIDRLKDPLPAVTHIVSRASAEDLMLFYNLPAFPRGDTTSFLSSLARSQQLVKKKGEPDLYGACKIVLRDWSTGKFPRYTTPPISENHVTLGADLEKLYERDEVIFEILPTRKEMRKAGGLVKLSANDIESREAVMNELYMEDESSDEQSEDEDAIMMSVDEEESASGSGEGTEDEEADDVDDAMGGDDPEEDEEEEEYEELKEMAPALSNKQKRKRSAEPVTSHPKKKVTFAEEPKRAKQARLAMSPSAKRSSISREKVSVPKKPALTSKISKLPVRGTPVKVSKKVANAAGSRGRVHGATKAQEGAGGEQAYDFGKYF